MSASARRLKLLRHVVDNLDRVEFKPGPIGESDIPFIKGKIGPGFSVGIRKQAGESLVNLADEIFSGNSRYQRGTTFTSVYDQLSDLIIESCLGRASGEIEDVDVTLIEKEIDVWFNTKIGPRQLFVACLLSPTPGPPFSVGPVQFTYIDDFIPRSKTFSSGETFDLTFGHMFDEMRRDSASWIATVDVAECMEERAWELGELAVDIAIVGIQLVVPIGHSGRMARASARISPRVRSAISRAGTTVSVRGTNASPGRAMGPGALQHYLVQGAQVLQAVGPRIKVFLEGCGLLPVLEQAWADAAYWFHEGLAEPLDTIAVSKLETAIEVLLRAQSSSGSKSRLLKAIHAFYGLTREQFINADSQISVEKFATGFVTDRSRILHGTWSTLSQSLRDSRPALTALVHGLLASYAFELETYLSDVGRSDNIEQFLSYVEARHRSARLGATDPG